MNPTVQNSGKLLILGILAAALLLAGASWWFRYNATHRAAEFWGPEAVQMIRDAPRVYFTDSGFSKLAGETGTVHDVSSARGLTHLRNALLENRSFEFDVPAYDTLVLPPVKYQLTFLGPPGSGEFLRLCFASDHTWVIAMTPTISRNKNEAVSCRPIAKGLAEMFDEFAEMPVLSQ